MAVSQDDDFTARLERLKAMGHAVRPAAAGALPREGRAVQRRPLSRRAEIAGNALYPLSLAGAFVLGMVAVLIGRYARFQVMGPEFAKDDVDLDLLVASALGGGVSFVLAQMLRLESKEHLALQAAGVFAMICTIHNLFHWLPGPMAMVFAPDYVERVVATTDANSILFRGLSLVLGEAPAGQGDLAVAGDVAADQATMLSAPDGSGSGLPQRLRLDSEK